MRTECFSAFRLAFLNFVSIEYKGDPDHGPSRRIWPSPECRLGLLPKKLGLSLTDKQNAVPDWLGIPTWDCKSYPGQNILESLKNTLVLKIQDSFVL